MRQPASAAPSAACGRCSTGFNPGYYETSFENLLVVAQVESARAIDAIPEIAAVDGIDVLFIGPRDLSATLGKLNQFDDPVVRGQIDRAADAILKTGKLLGSTAISGKDREGDGGARLPLHHSGQRRDPAWARRPHHAGGC